MLLKYFIWAVGGIFFLYGLFKKPELIAILLFTCVVADVNFDLKGLPLNFRATITVVLLFRVLGEQSKTNYPGFFSNSLGWHLVFFILYIALVSMMTGLLDLTLVKELTLRFVSAYLGYYYFFKKNSFYYLRIAMICGGLICLIDLGYTYAFEGGFPVVRAYYLFVPAFEYYNHNFFGYICGAAFAFLLSDYLSREASGKITLVFIPLMFLGVLLSTSRGAMVAMVIVTVILIGKALMSKNSGKKAYTLITITVVCVILSMFIMQIAVSVLGINSEFLDTITVRLVDEPLAMINKMMGNSYSVDSMETVEWREEASNLAYNYYMGLPASDQALGIGYGGFLARDIGHGYDAHNGVLLILIELGAVGTMIYTTLILSFWAKVRQLKLSSPALVSIFFIILFVTSHNKEITSFFSFLIMGSLIGQIKYASMPQEEVSEEDQAAVLANQ